jgi:hypothetical protein
MQRPQPRSGEDARPGPGTNRRQTDRPAEQKWRVITGAVREARVRDGVERCSSLYRRLVGRTRSGRRLRCGGASQGRAVYATRAVVVAPAGAQGLEVVSMYQIASVSRRAMSTRAIERPRWRPSRVLVRR